MVLDEPVDYLVDGVLLVADLLVEVEVDVGLVGDRSAQVELVALYIFNYTFFRSRSDSLTLERRLMATTWLWYSCLSRSKCFSMTSMFY